LSRMAARAETRVPKTAIVRAVPVRQKFEV
jgi:hypothetical protein